MHTPSRIEIRHWLATETREQIVHRLESIECPDTREDVRDFLNLEKGLHKASLEKDGSAYAYKLHNAGLEKEGGPYSLVTDGERSIYMEHQEAQRRLRADRVIAPAENMPQVEIPDEVLAKIQAMGGKIHQENP